MQAGSQGGPLLRRERVRQGRSSLRAQKGAQEACTRPDMGLGEDSGGPSVSPVSSRLCQKPAHHSDVLRVSLTLSNDPGPPQDQLRGSPVLAKQLCPHRTGLFEGSARQHQWLVAARPLPTLLESTPGERKLRRAHDRDSRGK